MIVKYTTNNSQPRNTVCTPPDKTQKQPEQTQENATSANTNHTARLLILFTGQCKILTTESQTGASVILPITSSNVDWFAKCFHTLYPLQDIKALYKYCIIIIIITVWLSNLWQSSLKKPLHLNVLMHYLVKYLDTFWCTVVASAPLYCTIV